MIGVSPSAPILEPTISYIAVIYLPGYLRGMLLTYISITRHQTRFSVSNGLKCRCDLKDVIVEIDRIVRPEGYFVVQDSIEMMNKVASILRSLHWSVKLHQNQFLIGIKGFWRP